MKIIKQRGTTTNENEEKLKTTLLQETEKELLKMIDQLQTVREGDLQTLEKSILTACLSSISIMHENMSGTWSSIRSIHVESVVERGGG